MSFIIPTITLPADNIINVGTSGQCSVLKVTVQDAMPSSENTFTEYRQSHRLDFGWKRCLFFLYLCVAGVLGVRLVISMGLLLLHLKKSTVETIGSIKLVRDDSYLKNGSFLNYIFLDSKNLSKIEEEQVLAHEMAHVSCLHSLDKLLSNIIQVILWFNPFSYWLSNAIEENQEFQADGIVIRSANKKRYAELLLGLSSNSGSIYSHHFNRQPLKSRIKMLFAKPSTNSKKFLYVLLIPLITLCCVAFASKKSLTTGIKEIEVRMTNAKLPSLLKGPSSFIDNRQMKPGKRHFVHKRRTSALIRIQSDSVIVKEKRDTTNDNDWFLKAFKDASFQAEDSIRFSEDHSIMKLYGNAKVKSKNYSMKGDLIKIDYKEKRVYCIGNAEIQDRTSAIAK